MDMVDSFDFNLVWSALGGLITLLMFGICVYFLIVKPCTESILLSIGSFIHLITSLFSSIGFAILARMHGPEYFHENGIFAVVGGINLIGTICFSAGLIVLILNYVRINKKMKLENYS